MNANATAMNYMSQTASQARRESWTRTQIGRRQIFSRQILENEVFRIRVTSGHLWVTFEGSPDDHHLSDGDSRRFYGPGLLVAEGIEQGALIEISQSPLSSVAT
ncbi:DUF2917 domain-containing protein [Luteolibacter luteus]|uniref:DUF2917 domain-containing protein n=1 Tax=Luteolibacter luteus TaxID=2728835 RepID=A0A858RG56_9BACT|nr:DUF2917 domain-containing protein [Luteolibacter luteus]QJE95827.1 DUF2917 domain-containing protein [Luteolibacter luteus]